MDMPAPANIAAQPVAPAMPAPKHDVTIVTTRKLAQAKVMGVPPEEFGIERGARSIKDCNYCFHEIVTKTVSQLIDEGFDEEQVNRLEDYTGNTEIETLSRDTVAEHYNTVSASSNKAARLVKVTEHYIRMDYEGNGRACLYQVITAGTQGDVLKKDGKEAITPFDAIPFASCTPVPQPHRFFGRSVADLVMPVQREKTALKRGGLDNLYLHNNPRVEVAETTAGPNTLDDLLVSRPGGIVRTKTPGGLNWQVVPDITSSIYPMLQYLDAELETRTGVSKQSQGVDANALQNQSATAVAQVFSASQMRMKLIARVLAEGVKDMFSLLHGTIRKHGQQTETVRLRNSWTQVDPRDWKTRNDMTINVGLGTGSKAQQFAQMMALLNVQKELLLGGKANLVDDTNLFNGVSAIAKILGHKNADQFFNDPQAKDPQTGELLHPPVPPAPDPAILKIQAEKEMKQQELQMKGQELQANAVIDQKADERKAGIEQVQMQADIEAQDRKTQAEMALAQQKFDLERELKLIDAQLKRELQMAELDMKRELHEQTLSQGHLQMAATAQSHDAKIEQTKAVTKAKTEKKAAKPEKPAKDPHAETVKHLQDVVSKNAEQIKEVHAAVSELSKPKRVVRDSSGKITHVETAKD